MAEDATNSRPSRYKSHRRKPSGEELPPSDHASSPSGEDGVVRTKSRYHRRPGTAGTSQGETVPLPSPLPPPPPPPQPEMPSRYHSKHHESSSKPTHQDQRKQQMRQIEPNANISNDRYATASAQPGAHDNRESDAAVTRGGRRGPDVELPDRPPQSHSPTTPPSAPTGELFPPPRPIEKPVRHDGPPQSNQIRATRGLTELPYYEEEADAGCWGALFRRKRGDDSPARVDTAAIHPPRTSKGEQIPIRPGGGGAVLGIDAPVSAVNAGDRLVLVEFGRSKRVFPVTPTTTSLDIVKSAAICMSERIDVKSAVLLEYFSTVGVQRPLRRYEYVRNVMNSWDSDRQNSLLLVDPVSGSVEPELTTAGVPKQRPEEQSWYLFYSQKMGKWEKRFVTLRPDGQILCQKDADKLKDVANVCHLSDFDIYIPTPERLKKKIKPPKKLCFAIKSQQKTSMFETTDNFVHFFATGDKPTAESFHKAVQGWRSWYLVNVLEEGRKEKPANPVADGRDRHTSNDHAKTHRVQDSVGSHYQLGSFKPLIDLEVFEKPETSRSSDDAAFTKSANQFDVNISPERRASTAKRKHPPIALNKKAQLKDDEPLANLQRSGSVNKRTVAAERKLREDEPLANLHRSGSLSKRTVAAERRAEPSEFKNTGLLGRQYSQRRKDYEEREAQPEEPWTAGPNLLNGEGVQRRTSTRRQGEVKRSSSTRDRETRHRHGESSGLQRADSVSRQKPKPLVDLTPEYREAPQFAKKSLGKGFVPESNGGGGLIDNATSPEDVLGIPASTEWRHRGQQNSPAMADRTGSGSGSGSQSSQPLRRRVSQTRSPVQAAFTGEGLLGAQEKQGWGGHSKGRGVIDGSRANGKPLVDLTYDDTFVNGSLLNKVKMNEGIPAPIVDRSGEKGF